MLDFTGVKCPVCGVPFQKDDDIVVCPECGAPYHRECYQEKGCCIFQELHEQGREWQPPAPPKAPDPSAEIKDRECPFCGILNYHSALFCSHCGASLLGSPEQHKNSPGQQGAGNGTWPPYNGVPRGPYGAPASPYSYPFDPMGGVSPADTLDSGVTFGDASKLVKQNTAYYMPVFRYIKQSRRNKFNFSAFLFSGAWMLYRKQYKYGAVVTALMLLLHLLYQAAFWLICTPTLNALALQAGVDITESAALTSEQLMAVSALAAADLSSYLKIVSPFLVLAAMLAVMIVVGIRGNRMYMNHCVRTVRLVRAEGTEGDPNMTLDAKGGVNSAVTLCVAVCFFILQNVLPILLM